MTTQTKALWTWDTETDPINPKVVTFPNKLPTKSGVRPDDLEPFVGVPIQYYGTPPRKVDPKTILEWIRWSEDKIEQDTGLLLCPTWIAAPPAKSVAEVLAIQLGVVGSVQELGVDYDLADAAYDFVFQRAQDEGWMALNLRFRPIRDLAYIGADDQVVKQYASIQSYSYIYPLLNEFFKVPPSWVVEDQDYGLIRLVPATNVMMLPLFAMQLAFMGFAESIPGAIRIQYVAGLTQSDYNTRFSFMKELVLAHTAVKALETIQGSVNYGMTETELQLDGIEYRAKYDKDGPYKHLITRFENRRDAMMKTARDMVSGPVITTL